MDALSGDGSAYRVTTSLLPGLDFAVRCAGLLTDEDLYKPTPCPPWAVIDVLAHLTDSLERIGAAMWCGSLPDEPREPTGGLEALRSRLAAVTCSMADAVTRRRADRRPVSINDVPLRQQHLLHAAAIEAAVHAWDIGVSLGNPQPIDEALAASLLTRLEEVVNPETSAGCFSPPRPCATDSPPPDRLLSALGRDPRWRPRSR